VPRAAPDAPRHRVARQVFVAMCLVCAEDARTKIRFIFECFSNRADLVTRAK
jgi:hypothetical protein